MKTQNNKNIFRNGIIKDTKSKVKHYYLLPTINDKNGAMITITASTVKELNKTLFNIVEGNKNIKVTK